MITEQLVHGLVIGSVIAFVAIGYALVYSVLRFINFAHGEVMTLGAYFCYIFSRVLNIRFFAVAIILSILLTGIVGVVIERLAYKPLRTRGRLSMLLSSLGLSISIQATLALIFGSSPLVYGVEDRVFSVAGHPFYSRELIVTLALILAFVLLNLALTRSNVGLAVRAISDNPRRAVLLGVPVDQVVSVVFFVSSALAAIGGISIAVETGLTPSMGFEYTVWAFAAAVIAGLGSIRGIVLAGLLLGITIAFGMAYTSVLFANGIALVLMTLVLLVRPQGIFSIRKRAY